MLEYKCADDRPGYATFGKSIRSERDVIVLSDTTTHRQLKKRITTELQTRQLSDTTGTNFYGVYISDGKFATKIVKITQANWQGCRDILLKDETHTLRVENCNAPPGWEWGAARKEEQEKERKKCKCVVQ